MSNSADSSEVCRCQDPLPKLADYWLCSACGFKRRYMEKISVGRGGIVARCGECRWSARKRGESESTVALGLCRFLTTTTLLAGEYRSSDTYSLCDDCINAEIARNPTADVLDGREVPV